MSPVRPILIFELPISNLAINKGQTSGYHFRLTQRRSPASLHVVDIFYESDRVMRLSIPASFSVDYKLPSTVRARPPQGHPTRAPNRSLYHTMTRPVAKFVAALLLFGGTPMIVSPKEEDKKGATVTEWIDWSESNVTVLFFIVHDCPICNRYVPEINRIVRDYRNRGFRFTAVYSEADFSQEDGQKHARDYHFDLPFVIDSEHRFAAQFGVKVVPEAVVLNSKRELLYRGRIDDLYADIDKQRPTATRHDLREALDNIAAGSKADRPSVPAVGCPINYDPPRS